MIFQIVLSCSVNVYQGMSFNSSIPAQKIHGCNNYHIPKIYKNILGCPTRYDVTAPLAELLREHLLHLANLIGLGQNVLQLHLHLHHILSRGCLWDIRRWESEADFGGVP